MSLDDEQLTNLYKKIDKAEPSSMVDARIRRTAQKAGNAERNKLFTRWVSVAAVLVLSVGVVLRVVQETPVKQDFEEQVMSPLPVEEAVRSEDKQEVQGLNETRQKAKEQADLMEMETTESLRDDSPESLQSSAPRVLQKKVAPAVAAPPTDMMLEKDAIEAELAEPAKMGASRFSTVAEAWCGQDDLAGVEDRQQWIERMEQLKQLDMMDQVNCIQQLLNQQLAQ